MGSLSRTSKLGAYRIFLSSSYIPTIKLNEIPRSHLAGVPIIVLNTKVWFGNPCVRAIYKLCYSIMQITLKVNLVGNMDALSPTLSILEVSR